MAAKILISGNGVSIKERVRRIAQRANCGHRTEDGNCKETGKLCINIDDNRCLKLNRSN